MLKLSIDILVKFINRSPVSKGKGMKTKSTKFTWLPKLLILFFILVSLIFPIPGAYTVKIEVSDNTTYTFGAKIMNASECQHVANFLEEQVVKSVYSTAKVECTNRLLDLIRYKIGSIKSKFD